MVPLPDCTGALTLRLDDNVGVLRLAEEVMPASESPLGAATESTLGAVIPSARCRAAIGCEFSAPKTLGTAAFLAAATGALGAGSAGDSVTTTDDFATGAGAVRLAMGGAKFGFGMEGGTVTCGGAT